MNVQREWLLRVYHTPSNPKRLFFLVLLLTLTSLLAGSVFTYAYGMHCKGLVPDQILCLLGVQ